MRKYLIAAALTVAFATPALAEQFYISPSTRRATNAR